MSKQPHSKRKKKKTTIEELVDGSIQLPGMEFFIDHGGDEKYSLLERMMRALNYDHATQTGLETNSLVVRDRHSGVPLHFAPSATDLVTP
jgi:hypothetical protein